MRTEWIELPKSALPAGNRAAVGIRRAVDPASQKPYDGTFDKLGADPRQLVRSFRLADRQLLLGEPIVVEHQVALRGSGTWQEPIGGNYRARGRDDNFFFVMVHADGTRVPDPYGPERWMMGGISTTIKVQDGKPMSYWHAVQRYVAVDRPGRYDLYCLEFQHGHEVVGWRAGMAAALQHEAGGRYVLGPEGNELLHPDGKPAGKRVSPAWDERPSPSPLFAQLPAALRGALDRRELEALAGFAHFVVEVRAGSPAEQRAMVARWEPLAVTTNRMMQADRAEAARQAIWFARQNDFLPSLERWLDAKRDTPPQDLTGLAMRPDKRALDLLLRKGGAYGMSALRHVPTPLVAGAIPRVIDRLDDPTDQIRSYAFGALSQWTGERFGAEWPGYHAGRPTIEEGRRLKPTIRAWWQQHRKGFVPKSK